jgi:hypothetical protein
MEGCTYAGVVFHLVVNCPGKGVSTDDFGRCATGVVQDIAVLLEPHALSTHSTG